MIKKIKKMKISGRVLNVGDGDAIIIKAEKNQESLLIIIDGGNTCDQKKVLNEIDQYCVDLKKDAPDLIVCTHYDSDHIAGVISLIEKYQNKIKMIWIHQPRGVLEDAFRIAPMVLENITRNKVLTDINVFRIKNSYSTSNNRAEFLFIIESIRQLSNVVELIKKYKIPTAEPFAGCKYTGWEEIKVIGPTLKYYNSIFNSITNITEIFDNEFDNRILESNKIKLKIIGNPCDLLKTNSVISKTNKASVIIKFKCENGNYLFTGDAGIESFKNTMGYPDSIRNMKFLKIPHHGSNNNISKELVDLINPEIAYNSGDKYEDEEVIDCLRRVTGRVVRTTKKDGDLDF